MVILSNIIFDKFIIIQQHTLIKSFIQSIKQKKLVNKDCENSLKLNILT
jgi:hypothetical protein